MADATALCHLEQRDTPVRRQILQFVGFFAINFADGRGFLAELRVQGGVEARRDEKQNPRGKYADDECQHARVPERQSRAHARRMDSHTSPPPSMYPTPRTVCSSFLSYGSSILRRNRAIVTSMTLSSGVARAVACHTSRANISRDTTAPLWRRRYSSISNSFTVRSRGFAPLDTLCVTRSISRSSCCSLRI